MLNAQSFACASIGSGLPGVLDFDFSGSHRVCAFLKSEKEGADASGS
jgi:hypothetical protein